MKELSNLQIAMLSPVKRKTYLRRKERARRSVLEEITLVPCRIPSLGFMIRTSQQQMTRLQAACEAYAKLEEKCANYKARLEAEYGGES